MSKSKKMSKSKRPQQLKNPRHKNKASKQVVSTRKLKSNGVANAKNRAGSQDSADNSFATFRDRKLSLWQSVVEDVLAQKQTLKVTGKVGMKAMAAFSSADREALRASPQARAATALAELLSAGHPLSDPKPKQLSGSSVMKMAAGETAMECSKLALQLAWAKATGDIHAAETLGDELKYGTCDPLWSECVEQYLNYLAKNKGSIPYRSGGDYVLDLPLPKNAVVAIIGDWGTGAASAVRLLEQISRKKPDLVIHLGDIYYSGTKSEVQGSFLEICRTTLGDIPLVSLCGNHDMYSGGAGYYWLVDQLGQRASYFCIRNADWQFLAMDTGYNDSNPFSVASNVTSVNTDELAWHKSIIGKGKRRTVLLSHHQLFSAYEAIGTRYVNELLLGQFQDVLERVDIWFWGHEHRLDIYAPHLGLKRGRCVGCSAVPVFVEKDYYKSKSDVPLLQIGKKTKQPIMLGDNDTIYNHAYAIMSLNGGNAQVSYYQDTDEEKPIYVESIT